MNGPGTTFPVFGSTWVIRGEGAIFALNDFVTGPSPGISACALPASPAATLRWTVYEPAFTGTTFQVNVREVPAFSGPSAHVFTYAVCPPPGGLTTWLCTGSFAGVPGPSSTTQIGRLFAASSGYFST